MKSNAITGLLSAAFAVGGVLADSFAWERLEKDKAVRFPIELTSTSTRD
jgi:hypothetical protein